MLGDIRSWMEKGPQAQAQQSASDPDLPPLFGQKPVQAAPAPEVVQTRRLFSPAFKSQRAELSQTPVPQAPHKLAPKSFSIFDVPKREVKDLTGRQRLLALLRD